ncbi:MAG: DUF1571 domain-containing protein [Myxococcota bacterium]
MLWLILLTATAAPPETISTLLTEVSAANASLQDATYTVERSEWVGGRQLPPQTIAVRYRRPEALWLQWVDAVYPGRKLLYQKGWNGGQLRVRPSSYLPLLNLSPTGMIAMRDSRHPVWMISLSRIVDKVLGVTALLAQRPELVAEYTDEGTQRAGGTDSRCYRVTLPYEREPALYAPQVRVCVGLDSRLPTRFSAWKNEDGAIRQVEDYVFQDLVVNPGLTDADFDPGAL